MKKSRVFIPILLALIVAGGGSMLVYSWVQKQAVPKEIVQVQNEAVPVAVATLDLPWGQNSKSR